MTRKCFFIDRIDPCEDCVILSGQSAHHLENVLRAGTGDVIELRDGAGQAWRGIVEGKAGDGLRIRLKGQCQVHGESPLRLSLCLALARSDRMDLVVRQATEIGIHALLAFRAQRSQYGLQGAQASRRLDRWSRIAREAMCQCGRIRVPEIRILSDVPGLLSHVVKEGEAGGVLRILAWEEECEQTLLDLWRSFPEFGEVLAVVGPEGGWTRGEVDQFAGAGFHAVHLGARALRFETAALALVTSAQLLWGDLGR